MLQTTALHINFTSVSTFHNQKAFFFRDKLQALKSLTFLIFKTCLMKETKTKNRKTKKKETEFQRIPNAQIAT